MSASGDPALCPVGHADTVRLLSTIALAGSGSRATAMPTSGGGCCGGACGCG